MNFKILLNTLHAYVLITNILRNTLLTETIYRKINFGMDRYYIFFI